MTKITNKQKALEEKMKKREIRKINTVRFNREISRQLVDRLIEIKNCTLLTNKFDCNEYEFNGRKLRRGEEKWCHCPDFVNCPAFNHYTNHEILANRRKISKAKG